MVDLNEVGALQEALDTLREQVSNEEFQRELLEEKLSGLDLQLDNYGWSDVHGYDDDGPTLSQVKDISRQIRNATARNVWAKNGWKLRYNYVFAGGIHYDNIPGMDREGRGAKPIHVAALNDPVNKQNFFGRGAWERCEGALYSDGIALYIGEETGRKRRISEFPLNQITGVYSNPDDASEVWAYRRTWTHRPNTGNPQERNEWIFRNIFWEKNDRKTISVDGKPEPVSKTKRVFGGVVNDLPGWQWGVPDAFSGLSWARQYRDALLNGKSMSDAMATIAYQITNPSKKAAQNTGVKMSGARSGGGGTATMVEGQQMQSMTTAGKSYDYDASRPILAAMAAGIGVSVVALSSDPGAAGSSYGSAATLDLPTQLMAEARREFHVDLHTEVLEWLGVTDPEVWFEPLVDATDLLRQMQAAVTKWGTGLFSPEEIKADLESVLGRDAVSPVPDGVLIPNNEKSIARGDIDTDSTGMGAAVGQGISTGTGGSPQNNDTRSDTIS